MSKPGSQSNNVFCYDTLMEPEFVRELISRIPDMNDSYVKGYKKYFDGKVGYFSAVYDNKSIIEGILLTGLSDEELGILDEYEGVRYGIYKRVSV